MPYRIAKMLMRDEKIWIKNNAVCSPNPFNNPLNVVCKYIKGQMIAIICNGWQRDSISNKNIHKSSPQKKKKPPANVPIITVKRTEREMVS